MDFRILGSLEVWDGDRQLELGGPKRRAVLALLLLHANEVVALDRLVDQLWGEKAPRNAAAAIRTHVSRLRKELGTEVVATRAWGYVLRIEPSALDLARFEQLSAEAGSLPARDRAGRLREALALWRGPPLQDLAFESGLAADIGRLEELRLTVLENRIDADLEAGNQAGLVGELEALIAEHPLRERLRGQLILALYRTGRQAEALEVYRETRRVLTEQLGLEPSPALKELERAILRQDPSLDAQAASTHAEPLAVAPESKRRRLPSVALLALLALGLGGAATAIALTHQQRNASAGTVINQILETLTTTGNPTTDAKTPRTTDRKKTSPATTAKTHTTHAATTTTNHVSSTRPTTTVAHKPPKKKKQIAPPPRRAAITDSFVGSSLNGGAWVTDQQSAGTSQGVQGGLLLTASNTASSGFHDGILTRCQAQGDFDARAHFTLLNWPAGDNVSFAVNAPNLGNTFVQDAVGGDRYGLFVQPSGFITIPAYAPSGDLWLSRRGHITTAYVLPASASRWHQIARFGGSTSDTWVGVAIWNISNFGGQPVSVRVDSFELHAVGLSC